MKARLALLRRKLAEAVALVDELLTRKDGDESCIANTDSFGATAQPVAAASTRAIASNAALTFDPERAAKPKLDNLPTSPESIAVASLFNRRLTTPWNTREIKAFRDAVKRGALTLEVMTIIASYYAAERSKGPNGIHRRDLLTFLNNFDGELDRAVAFNKPKKPMTRPPTETTEQYNRRLAESQQRADQLNGAAK